MENQHWADERIPLLLDTLSAVRFISAEPLLQKVSLGRWFFGDRWPYDKHPTSSIDWVIIGGESGRRHRPFDPEWARRLVTECRIEGVACFVKQLGGARPGNKIEDLPPDLKVREFPR